MGDYPKYEKADEYTLRILIEAGDEITLNKLYQNKALLEKQIADYQRRLNLTNEYIAAAEKLGIKEKEETKENEQQK